MYLSDSALFSFIVKSFTFLNKVYNFFMISMALLVMMSHT